jgi:hypothetical protein
MAIAIIPIKQEAFDRLVTFGVSNRASCGICGNKLPKEMPIYEFRYRDGKFYKTLRICQYCLDRLAECGRAKIDKNFYKEWEAKMLLANL